MVKALRKHLPNAFFGELVLIRAHLVRCAHYERVFFLGGQRGMRGVDTFMDLYLSLFSTDIHMMVSDPEKVVRDGEEVLACVHAFA